MNLYDLKTGRLLTPYPGAWANTVAVARKTPTRFVTGGSEGSLLLWERDKPGSRRSARGTRASDFGYSIQCWRCSASGSYGGNSAAGHPARRRRPRLHPQFRPSLDLAVRADLAVPAQSRQRAAGGRFRYTSTATLSPALDHPVMVEACPGAGKTRFGLEVAYHLIANGTVRRVLVFVPSLGISDGWIDAASAATRGSPTIPLLGSRNWTPAIETRAP